MKLKLTLLLLCSVFILSNVTAQDVPDWVWKTPMTKVHPTGEYTENFPVTQDQIQFQNPNTTTRVINQNGLSFVLPPNIRPFPSPATQSEIDAANMKGNDQVMYISWNSFQNPTFFGCGYAFSSNGGTNWTGNNTTYSPNSGDPGPWIWPTGSTWAGRLGLSCIQGAGYSTNNGTNWTFAQNFTGGSSFDKNLSAVDDVTGSPFFGRAYTVWTYFSTNRIYMSWSSNGGVTWSAGALVSPPPSGGHHHQGCDVEVGPGGVVHVIWANCTTNGQNSTEDFLGYARSTDGGVTWVGVTDNAVDVNGIRAANLYNGIRANGFPRLAVDNSGGPRNGWIYAALSEKTVAPATDVADMCLARSTNNGTTWTHTRINQDTPGNGKYQYMGDIDVTSNGTVVCSYYDQRNTTSPVTEYWMSTSTDGGNTWTDVAVSDHTFTPAPIPGLAGGYQGDYTGITTAAGKVWPFWADNSSGVYQAWTTGITIGGGSGNNCTNTASTWVNRPVVPAQSYFGCSAWIGDTLYFQAPTNAGAGATTVYRYTYGGSWTTGVPMPVARTGGAMVSAGGKLYYSGGDPVGITAAGTNTLYEYTPSTGAWVLKANMPAALTAHQMVAWGDSVLVVVGGPYTGSGTNLAHHYYRIGSNTWGTTTNSLPSGQGRRSFGMGISGNKIIISSGFNTAFIKSTYVGTIGSNASTITWAAAPDVPTSYTGLSRPGSAYFGGYFFLVNGERATVGGYYDTTHVFNFNTNTWTGIINNIPFKRSNIFGHVTAKCINDTLSLFIPAGYGSVTGATPGAPTDLFHITRTGTFTSSGNNNTSMPEKFELSQNYPNPFNPATTIKFSLPKMSFVTLRIYDITGREIETLVNEIRGAGRYDVNFDASTLATGVYFYTLQTEDFQETRKMMLVK
jgi:hypothetical protein